MNCEVVAVGTELLLGQIVDTNSSWIGEQLALAGIDCFLQVKVGDNWDRIRDALQIALDRSDAVIVCGGLGPTQDDITRDVIAEVMGVELVEDPEVIERLHEIFGSRGRNMPMNNLRQAQVPEGASRIAQMPGTAPGLICPIGDKVIFAVPGVPYEMKEMVEGTVIPELRRRAGDTGVIRSRTIRTWGHSESGIAEMLGDRLEELDRTASRGSKYASPPRPIPPKKPMLLSLPRLVKWQKFLPTMSSVPKIKRWKRLFSTCFANVDSPLGWRNRLLVG